MVRTDLTAPADYVGPRVYPLQHYLRIAIRSHVGTCRRQGVDLDDDATVALAELLRCITPPNLLGIPSVAVPVGVSDGLPQGVQCIADRWRDDLALAAAADLETALGTITPIDPVTS